MADFSAGDGPTPEPDDVRLDAPAYHRNIAPILSALDELLPTPPADIVEIGCGTGQHITAFARKFPKHNWWPTDIATEHLASTRAWMAETNADNIGAPALLDAASADWDLGQPGRPPQHLQAIFSANVIHISPWSTTTGLLAGAGRHLEPGGSLLLYGRSVSTATTRHRATKRSTVVCASRTRSGVSATPPTSSQPLPQRGSILAEKIDMPANNFILRFKRR